MTWFKCSNCGYTLQADAPPADSICPNCKDKCTFSDVTCYIPDCDHGDGKEHIDRRLL